MFLLIRSFLWSRSSSLHQSPEFLFTPIIFTLPSLGLSYVATNNQFPQVFLSLYSLLRLLEPHPHFFDLHFHLLWLPKENISFNATFSPLLLLRSLTSFPITIHRHFNFSWVSLWDASHKDAENLIWVTQTAARIFLPWIIREKYILYVDADTLWGRDFRLELHTLLRDHPKYRIYISHDCSAIRPDHSNWFAPYLEDRRHNIDCFGNTGVFIIPNDPGDLAWRLEKAVPMFNQYAGMWPDQDVLNYMYSCEEKYLLTPEWNNHWSCLNSLHGHEHGLEDAIVHHGHDIPFVNISKEWDLRLRKWEQMRKSRRRIEKGEFFEREGE